MLNRLGVALMQGLALLPLAWLRGLGWLLGLLLYAVAAPRRRVARINLGLCFPDLSPGALQALPLVLLGLPHPASFEVLFA